MFTCDCGSRMLYDKDTSETLAICENPDCSDTYPVKLCVKCDRVLHDLGPRKDDADGNEKDPMRCMVCCDTHGLDETPDGVDFDWHGVYCCPSCGSFDVSMRAKLEYWVKFNTATAAYEKDDEMSETEVEFNDGGSCYSCGHDWDDSDTVTGKEFSTRLRAAA